MIKRTIKKISAIVAAAFVAALSVFIFPLNAAPAAAETETPSDVLSDLQIDEKFSATSYPSKPDDYSLNVIQIAESVDKQLFIYVYQPSDETKELTATAINLSTSVPSDNVQIDKDFTYYDLTLISTSGVFDKYLVENLEVKSDVLRFYEIASIYREFDDSIDNSATDDNTLTEMAYNVGQLWTATTYEGTVIYAMDYQDTIIVENKHVGFIRYLDLQLFANSTATDSHYLAFSTDKPIDTLLQAELIYSYQVFYQQKNSLFSTNDKESLSQLVTSEKRLDRSTIFSKDNWFSNDYEYNRIQSIDEFFENETAELRDETVHALSDKEWILRFHESSYFYSGYFTTSSDSVLQNYCEIYQYQIVSDVSILRLKYEYQGDIYDLGVVDNVQTPDTVPDGTAQPDVDPFGFLKEFINEVMSKVDAIGQIILTVASLIVGGGVIFLIVWVIIQFLKLLFGGGRRG